MPDEAIQPENTSEPIEETTTQVLESQSDVSTSLEEEPVGDSYAPFTLEPRPILPPDPKRPAIPEDKSKKAKDEASQSPFSITVGQVYDGPFDLLLDLIRKQNIDIYDIPIARITSQFLEYTHHLKQTDVDAAGEFIYMASLLIHIKSKTLLPRDPSDPTGADSEDPRRELVERLLEHERFKSAAQMLMQKQQIEEATWTTPGMPNFRKDAGEGGGRVLDEDREIAADTVDLVRVFQEILARLRARPVLNVDEESVTVAQMIDYVKRRLLMEDKPVSLRRLLHNTHTERALICMFLAMLELVRLQAVLLHQPIQQGDILIKKTDNFDAVFTDQQNARDDWR
jgi:segregation and condensation protein A